MKALKSQIVYLVSVPPPPHTHTPSVNMFNDRILTYLAPWANKAMMVVVIQHHIIRIELSCCRRSWGAWSLPLADCGSPPQALCYRYPSEMSFIEEARGGGELQLVSYLHNTLCNSSGVAKLHRLAFFFFAFFVLCFPLVPPCSSVI